MPGRESDWECFTIGHEAKTEKLRALNTYKFSQLKETRDVYESKRGGHWGAE